MEKIKIAIYITWYMDTTCRENLNALAFILQNCKHILSGLWISKLQKRLCLFNLIQKIVCETFSSWLNHVWGLCPNKFPVFFWTMMKGITHKVHIRRCRCCTRVRWTRRDRCRWRCRCLWVHTAPPPDTGTGTAGSDSPSHTETLRVVGKKWEWSSKN